MLRCSPLALNLGFSSHSHFTDVFQRSFGQIAAAKNKQDFEGLIQQYRLVFPPFIRRTERSSTPLMIGRLCHAWTNRENTERYENLVTTEILPSFHRATGYKGAYFLRKDGEDETEFVALTLFDDMEGVRAFAGENYEASVVPPEARKLLSRFDQRSPHYEIVFKPE